MAISSFRSDDAPPDPEDRVPPPEPDARPVAITEHPLPGEYGAHAFGRDIGAQLSRRLNAPLTALIYRANPWERRRDKVWLPVDARTGEFVRDWIVRVRSRYPETPFEDLALLPAPYANPSGARPANSGLLSRWFRRWVLLLNQAVVLAHLHQSTGLPLATLCQLRCQSLTGQSLRVDGTEPALRAAVAQNALDYRADVTARHGTGRYAPTDPGMLPLFPDMFVVPGSHPVGGKIAAEFVPVLPGRFDPLGPGWLPIAASYPGGGIPGLNLGSTRINPDLLQVRLFRHTYLQHLVNLGTDIFLVQELADHGSVQTTINSYVRVQDEKLREAVDLLAAHRLNIYGRPATNGLLLASAPARDIGTNDCTNPQVLALGREGCEYDRMCYSCDFFAADPSNIPDIKTEIHTCAMTLQRLLIEGDSDLKPHHVAVLNARRDGWQRDAHRPERPSGRPDPDRARASRDRRRDRAGPPHPGPLRWSQPRRQRHHTRTGGSLMSTDTPTSTGGKPEATQSGGRDPSRAIAAKKEQAAANRDKITAAIIALQRGGRPVNVQSVARAAGVHPHTLRRNPDLLQEVQHLRENSDQRPPVIHADPAAAASYKALKAQLLASQAEVADLRRELAQLRRDAHQVLGTALARSDPSIVDDLHREIAELRVQLMNERDTTRSLQATTATTSQDLIAAHEIARGYLRELNQTRDEFQRTRQELTKLRTTTAASEDTNRPRRTRRS
jgi:hypothetical protein